MAGGLPGWARELHWRLAAHLSLLSHEAWEVLVTEAEGGVQEARTELLLHYDRMHLLTMYADHPSVAGMNKAAAVQTAAGLGPNPPWFRELLVARAAEARAAATKNGRA
jgi:hypothetical protein